MKVLITSLAMTACVSVVIAAGATKPASLPASAPGSKPTSSTSSAPAYSSWPFDAAEAAKRQEETAKALGLPKEKIVDLGNKVTMKFVLIPAGKFMMGSPDAQHEVTIGKPYYMAVYKVTQAQYEQVMGAAKNPSSVKGKDFPVFQVTWKDAEAFCQAASKKTGKSIRLPTEEQWENACRAGANTKYFFGDDPAKLGDYAWFRDNWTGQMRAVGLKKPNAFGLYDINGLMWEYCGPAKYDPDKADAKDHVVRGATFGSRTPMFLMGVKLEAPSEPDAKGIDRYGMRVAMDAE